MSPLLRTLAFAAAGFVAASIYRDWQAGTARRKRLPIERWENEGGALPDTTTTASMTDDELSTDSQSPGMRSPT